MDKRKEVLISALKEREEGIRKLAADALEKLEMRDRLDHLVKKIESGEMLEKIRAIYALTDLKGQRVTEILIKAAKDPSEDVRAAALRVLGGKGESAMPALVEALKDASPVVVRVAVDSLSNYRDPRLLGPLMQILKSPDTGIVERALEVISRLGDKRAEEAMIYFAVKGNSKMKGLAIKALGEMDR
ncbi:MAG: HEAT repeat domain-containing protein [Deltaproteobacteria bacterium]|nr:HEAT repeat domain-containing protein [Deltaproteobacteria bacterium]